MVIVSLSAVPTSGVPVVLIVHKNPFRGVRLSALRILEVILGSRDGRN